MAAASPAAADATIESAMGAVVSVLPVLPPGQSRPEEPEGSGVVAPDGRHIITALHVIDGASEIIIRSFDGEVAGASLVGRDRFTDVAILRSDIALQGARFGTDPAPGDPVCAIGNAFGLGLSISCGVVSAVHKAGVGFNPVEDFVQTDAAVNPGASGGALVDEEGRVVGVLSAIFTKTSDANIGVNFAVAAPLVERVFVALVEDGRYSPPRTGLTLVDHPGRGETGRLAARVTAVAPGSPAERAGFRPGDRILEAGERRIRRPADLVSATARLALPSTLGVLIERDDGPMKLELALPAGEAEHAESEAVANEERP